MKTNYLKTILSTIILLITTTVLMAQHIEAGGWHSVVVCIDSTVKAFGENASGELGNGTTDDQSIPVTATGLSKIIAVSAGGDQLEAHSMALKSDGTVWAWGSNLYGGLGNGTTTGSTTPVQVLILTNVKAISCGGWHSVALKNDGTVWAWGWNTDGQIGDGTTTDRVIPTQVPGLSGITAIAAGTYHVLALKNDSTVWSWGDNISGQIGDGTTTDRTTPIQVSGLSKIIKIDAGRFFSLAVKSDGTVWTWGENLYGQLGDGTNTDRHTPVQVTGLSGITSGIVATGAFHCMAVKNDNTVWAWGRNTYGNLGDNTVDNRITPVQMLGISDVAGMSAGTNFSIIYKTDGTFWGCGRNASGQLGDGTFLQRNTLTQSQYVCPIMPTPSGFESESVIKSSEILAFPNPSTGGIFSIKFSDNINLSDYHFEVYDNLGKKVHQIDFSNANSESTIVIDLSYNPDGMYFMVASSGNKQITKKLIKQ